jgi:hypothetical protein
MSTSESQVSIAPPQATSVASTALEHLNAIHPFNQMPPPPPLIKEPHTLALGGKEMANAPTQKKKGKKKQPEMDSSAEMASGGIQVQTMLDAPEVLQATNNTQPKKQGQPPSSKNKKNN